MSLEIGEEVQAKQHWGVPICDEEGGEVWRKGATQGGARAMVAQMKEPPVVVGWWEKSLCVCLSFIHCPYVFATCLGETQHHRTCDDDVGDNMGWRGMRGRFVFLQGSRWGWTIRTGWVWQQGSCMSHRGIVTHTCLKHSCWQPQFLGHYWRWSGTCPLLDCSSVHAGEEGSAANLFWISAMRLWALVWIISWLTSCTSFWQSCTYSWHLCKFSIPNPSILLPEPRKFMNVTHIETSLLQGVYQLASGFSMAALHLGMESASNIGSSSCQEDRICT